MPLNQTLNAYFWKHCFVLFFVYVVTSIARELLDRLHLTFNRNVENLIFYSPTWGGERRVCIFIFRFFKNILKPLLWGQIEGDLMSAFLQIFKCWNILTYALAIMLKINCINLKKLFFMNARCLFLKKIFKTVSVIFNILQTLQQVKSTKISTIETHKNS